MSTSTLEQETINRSIMLGFAESTGLSDLSREPRRYLWTDAFAVCNFLELYRQTGEKQFLQLALKLVEQVHQVLGQQRKDSEHRGWLSGLEGEKALQHPTLGGLRIGKRLPERLAGDPPDEALEWDQDGQYFHYLTKWMHALVSVKRVTGKAIYGQWALELAKVAHAAFTYTPATGGTPRMFWKMSIDLSRPLVNSMGQHDPLDGLITYLQLQALARPRDSLGKPDLKTEIDDMRAICVGLHWATEDALGIGGLLADAYRLVQLIVRHDVQETALLETLLNDIEYSLQIFVTHHQLNLSAEYRLAFRELGLAIGLHAISRMQTQFGHHHGELAEEKQLTELLTKLRVYRRIHEMIEEFWMNPAHQSAKTWRDHADINQVMLATSLAPDGYLQL